MAKKHKSVVIKESAAVSPNREVGEVEAISKTSRTLELIFSACGLYASFLTWGYMQEKITGSAYRNDAGEEAKWKFSYVLNLSMSLFAFVLAWMAYSFEQYNNPRASEARMALPSSIVYLKPSLSNTLASPIGYYALTYINFPMLLLAKSCKLVPVMFMGWLLNGERYSRTQLLAVGCISLGVALFTIKPKDLISFGLESVAAQFMSEENFAQALSNEDGDPDPISRRLLGLALVGTNLMFDGYTNSAQKGINDRFKSPEFGSPSPFYSMCAMNGWGVALMALWLLVDLVLGVNFPQIWRQPELLGALYFIASFPQVWWDLFLFSATSAVGQLFIFYIIRSFSPMTLVTLTVTRKFFSILFSIVRFGHVVHPWQYAGMGLLFFGLLMNDTLKKTPTGASTKAKKE